MKVCIITSEVFLGKRRGGFGKLVRMIGRGLVDRGADVCVITWREPGMEPTLEIDGMEVMSYPYDLTTKSSLKHARDYTKVIPLIRRANADIYLSIDCMVETYISQKVMPDRKHVIWVQDPFDWNDFKAMSSIDPNYRISAPKFWITRTIYALAYRNADIVFTQALQYLDKIYRLYRVNPEKVTYLPNPLERIPEEPIRKSDDPTVCFLGRMDPQKRYWLFFKLASKFPKVRFIALGRPSFRYEDLYERVVRKYRDLENLEIKGFVSEEEKHEILNEGWILALPSIREGLPIAFLEALSHKCSLLSTVNPDNLTNKFGYYAKDIRNLFGGLKKLLGGDWKSKGELGRRYVEKNHRMELVLDKMFNKFQEVLHS